MQVIPVLSAFGGSTEELAEANPYQHIIPLTGPNFKGLAYFAQTKPLKSARAQLGAGKPDLGVRPLCVTAHFMERYEQRYQADDQVVASMMRQAAKIIMERYNDTYLDAYFIVRSTPVDLTPTDATGGDSVVKGYLGFPLVWTSPFGCNQAIVQQALRRASPSLPAANFAGMPSVGAAWTYIVHSSEEGPPQSSPKHKQDKMVVVGSARVFGRCMDTTWTPEEQLAIAHLAMALKELDGAGADFNSARTTEFYGHTPYFHFSGRIQGTEVVLPTVYSHIIFV